MKPAIMPARGQSKKESLNLVPILLLGLSTFPEINFAPWGLWLYLGVMIISLILEGILLKYQLTETPKTE